MKLLRICLLVLLAVVLPVRGALAASMACGPAGAASSAAAISAHQADHDHGHAHAHGAEHEQVAEIHDHAQHGHHGDSNPAHEKSHQDKCNMCSASCSSPPLPSASMGITEPMVLTAAAYPAISAPAPTFQSDGQERPPRTI